MAGGESVIPGRPSRPASIEDDGSSRRVELRRMKIGTKDCDWSAGGRMSNRKATAGVGGKHDERCPVPVASNRKETAPTVKRRLQPKGGTKERGLELRNGGWRHNWEGGV